MKKYEEVKEDLRQRIESGQYPVNSKIPTEPELEQMYEVSRITIRKAVDALVAEGYLSKRRRLGTIVKTEKPAEANLSIFDKLDRSKIHNTIDTFEVIPAGEYLAEELNIGPEDFVYHFIRYRTDNEGWNALENVYLPIDVVTGLKKEVLEKSLYAYIQEQLGLTIQSRHESVTAILPDALDEKYLHAKKTDPILCIESTTYTDAGVPFEHSYVHYLGSEYVFHSIKTS